ncbi:MULTISPECIES: response regulator transcription factor [unclassified Rathayibacter]|uniref:response regulator transcription factor n=1 Tax=unclassified Rathayibacter TaxID=2609250 RepID=UPI0006F5E5BF|nr:MULTISPECIES: response regulator transcription factor [unclassified Rathayibacter]KQP97468.1 two-component system response regulator [Rathayibacter sp. Leaf294]KQS07140.1 two-component system response regulator [Rathayibacter sp. Leaf185]
MNILVVEDDPAMGEALVGGLEDAGYQAVLTTNGVDALVAFNNAEFSAAIVDVMLPAMSGFEICRRIRELGRSTPIMLLTARDAIEDRVFGLDAGADDYLTKPFAFTELNARLRALLRRSPSLMSTSIEVGRITVDGSSIRRTADGTRIHVSPKELELLKLLITPVGSVVTRQRILSEIWGGGEIVDNNIVDQYVSYLRKKLPTEDTGVSIVTVRGKGYFLRPVE